jgi:hypothetical protein
MQVSSNLHDGYIQEWFLLIFVTSLVSSLSVIFVWKKYTVCFNITLIAWDFFFVLADKLIF